MATQRFHIIDTESDTADGLIQTADKRNVGLAWENDAPTGKYITCSLEDHWIITDEDYKLLNKYKRDAKNTN